MDKTISISLGGFSFIVDDRAYLKLKSYLDEIRVSLNGMEGTEDILSDVEVRIAELFKERLYAREVVNESDVDYIIEIMGRPEQYIDEDVEVEAKETQKSTTTEEKITKKLYRDPDDKIIAGVLSGISHYIGIEPWIIRLIWVVLFFLDTFISFTTITVIGYIILWIILPKAETATQKYEMYGQAGDFETIKRNVSQAASEMKSASNNIGKLMGFFFKVIQLFIGFILIATGLSMVVAAVSIIIAFFGGVPMNFFGYVFDYDWQYTLAIVFASLLFFIPALIITLLGAKLISKRVKISKVFVISSIIIWFLIAIASIILIVNVTTNYVSDIEYVEKESYVIESDTITLNFNDMRTANQKNFRWYQFAMDEIQEFDGGLHKEISDDITVVPSNSDELTVEIVYISKGRNLDKAKENAEVIDYKYIVQPDGQISFNKYLTLPKGTKFRNQNIKIVLHVPKNKTIYAINVDDIKFFDKLSGAYQYNDGDQKIYQFIGDNLKCMNCSDENEFIEANDLDADIRITPEGIKVQSGKEKVIINRNQIKVTDGSDSINIDISGN